MPCTDTIAKIHKLVLSISSQRELCRRLKITNEKLGSWLGKIRYFVNGKEEGVTSYRLRAWSQEDAEAILGDKYKLAYSEVALKKVDSSHYSLAYIHEVILKEENQSITSAAGELGIDSRAFNICLGKIEYALLKELDTEQFSALLDLNKPSEGPRISIKRKATTPLVSQSPQHFFYLPEQELATEVQETFYEQFEGCDIWGEGLFELSP